MASFTLDVHTYIYQNHKYSFCFIMYMCIVLSKQTTSSHVLLVAYICHIATYQKAEVLYQMGRFEEALVFYHMGARQRPDMDLFNQGVRKAQEAIEISLGGNKKKKRD